MICYKIFDSTDSRPIGSYINELNFPINLLDIDINMSLEEKIYQKLVEMNEQKKFKLGSLRALLDKKQETIRLKEQNNSRMTLEQTENLMKDTIIKHEEKSFMEQANKLIRNDAMNKLNTIRSALDKKQETIRLKEETNSRMTLKQTENLMKENSIKNTSSQEEKTIENGKEMSTNGNELATSDLNKSVCKIIDKRKLKYVDRSVQPDRIIIDPLTPKCPNASIRSYSQESAIDDSNDSICTIIDTQKLKYVDKSVQLDEVKPDRSVIDTLTPKYSYNSTQTDEVDQVIAGKKTVEKVTNEFMPRTFTNESVNYHEEPILNYFESSVSERVESTIHDNNKIRESDPSENQFERRIRRTTVDSVISDLSKISQSYFYSVKNVIQNLDDVIKSHDVPFPTNRNVLHSSTPSAQDFGFNRSYNHGLQISDNESSYDSDETLNDLMSDPLEKYSYYLPHFSGKDSENFLKQRKMDGLFLLRQFKENSKFPNFKYAISVHFKRKVYHIKIRELRRGFAIGEPKRDEKTFRSVPDIIDYFINTPLTIPKVEPFRFVLDPRLIVHASYFESQYGCNLDWSQTYSNKGKLKY